MTGTIYISTQEPVPGLAHFETLSLPRLTVVVGANGAGKTKLLEGINGQGIRVGVKPDAVLSPTIRLIRNLEALPVSMFPRGSVTKQPDPTPTLLDRSFVAHFFILKNWMFRRLLAQLTSILGDEYGAARRLAEGGDILTQGVEGLKAKHPDKAAAIERAWDDELLQIEAEANSPTLLHAAMNPLPNLVLPPSYDREVAAICRLFHQSVTALAVYHDMAPMEISSSILGAATPESLIEPYEPHIPWIFEQYRDHMQQHSLDRMNDDLQNTSNALTREQFLKRYGPPPWNAMTALLQNFGLPYDIQWPELKVSGPVQFTLKKLHTQEEIEPQQLSSGEQVLLRFALSLFDYRSLKLSANMPELLLMDELDASLDADNLNRWANTVKDVLVEQKGINCILTTHSPITVALMPEDSIFLIEAGKPGLTKITKQQAMNRLTVGLPTLSVDYSGRRQIFVESDTDADVYGALSTHMKKVLELPRTLDFIATSVRKANVEQNSGCSVVESIVTKLTAAENPSVLGVLDWDGENTTHDRIHVVAEGSHYTLENLLLDPMLVGALLILDRTANFDFDHTAFDLKDCDPASLQILADKVLATLPLPDGASTDPVVNKYWGSTEINVPSYVQMMNGHEFEALLAKHHPSLRKYTGKGRGKLALSIVQDVIGPMPHLCPMPLASLLKELASRDI